MENFRLPPWARPKTLYRVQYSDSATTSTSDGLEAKDNCTFYAAERKGDFCQSIINQFTWSYRGAQLYITCFSDKEHAENWALKRPWNPRADAMNSWSLVTIDLSSTPDIYVFSLDALVDQLSLKLPSGAAQHIKGAYLCLHSIPKSAMIEMASPLEVKEAVEDRRWQERYDPADGYSSDDAAENNLNDDIIDMIEGSWD